MAQIPGLISHFVKQGLIDIAKKLIADKKAVGKDKEELEEFIKDRKFNLLGAKIRG